MISSIVQLIRIMIKAERRYTCQFNSKIPSFCAALRSLP